MNDDTTRLADAEAIIELARERAEPIPVDTDKLYVVHERTSEGAIDARVLDLEDHRAAPDRVRESVRLDRIADLTAYLAAHTTRTSSVIYVSERHRQVHAILDAITRDDPSWQSWRATVPLEPTPEWTAWAELDGSLVEQDDFALFCEDHLDDFVDPTGATMLELAQHFQASSTGEFRSGRRLDNGSVALTYNDETTATAGATGQLEVPSTFSIALAPFIGEDRYALTARLRYRVSGGKLRIGFALVRPDLVIRDAIDQIVDRLGEHSDRVYRGTPD